MLGGVIGLIIGKLVSEMLYIDVYWLHIFTILFTYYITFIHKVLKKPNGNKPNMQDHFECTKSHEGEEARPLYTLADWRYVQSKRFYHLFYIIYIYIICISCTRNITYLTLLHHTSLLKKNLKNGLILMPTLMIQESIIWLYLYVHL